MPRYFLGYWVYWDNGKENGNYYNGFYRGEYIGVYIGIMEKKMETTIIYRGYIGVILGLYIGSELRE